jgi:hypothetical protein
VPIVLVNLNLLAVLVALSSRPPIQKPGDKLLSNPKYKYVLSFTLDFGELLG